MILKDVIIDGETQQVPDIKVGNRVQISMEARDDIDLFNWLNDHNDEALVVSNVDYETFMIWLYGCEYGISMNLISDVFPEVDDMHTTLDDIIFGMDQIRDIKGNTRVTKISFIPASENESKLLKVDFEEGQSQSIELP